MSKASPLLAFLTLSLLLPACALADDQPHDLINNAVIRTYAYENGANLSGLMGHDPLFPSGMWLTPVLGCMGVLLAIWGILMTKRIIVP